MAQRKKTAMKRTNKVKRVSPRRSAVSKKSNRSGLAVLGYKAIEGEIQRLNDLLNHLKKKSSLVRRSLTYLEHEQKKVARQLQEAKRFLDKLKIRGIKILRNLPENAEELYYQLKHEFNRLSKKLRA